MNHSANDRLLNQCREETSFDRIVRNLDALPSGFLQVTGGEHIGRIILLNRSMTRLGLSGTACAVVVNRGKDGYFISHLEGEVQPLLNGEPTGNNPIPLPAGATIEIDGSQLIFHKGYSPAADNAGVELKK